MRKLQILSKAPLLTAELFTVNQLDVSLLGEKRRWYQIDIHPTVFVFPLTADNEIYLLRQYRHAINKEKIQTVGGFVDEGETALVAAKRELAEEAGLIARTWTEFGYFDGISTVMTDPFRFFLAEELTMGVQKLQAEEEITVIKMTLVEAIAKIVRGEITSYRTVTGILLLDKLKQAGKL